MSQRKAKLLANSKLTPNLFKKSAKMSASDNTKNATAVAIQGEDTQNLSIKKVIHSPIQCPP